MEWHPDKASLPLVGAVGSFLFWGIGTLAGTHPDGAILGFSGTMWMIWATAEKETRRRRDQNLRAEEHSHREPTRTVPERDDGRGSE